MAHFTATCDRYPFFGFCVRALRKPFNARGLENRSTLMRFRNGILDTQEVELTESEAGEVLKALQKMHTSPPTIGVDIQVSTVEQPPQKGAPK